MCPYRPRVVDADRSRDHEHAGKDGVVRDRESFLSVHVSSRNHRLFGGRAVVCETDVSPY